MIAEAHTHEAPINLAFKSCPVRILCPYDFARLDDAVIAAARRTHPMIAEPSGLRVSPEYVPPSDPQPWQDPLPDPPAGAARLRFSLLTLRELRVVITEYAARAGLDPCRRDDLVLAASELANNSIEHAGGSGELSIWTAGDKVVCEIRDRGHIADPLAGRIPPDPDSASGRGLWLVNQLCELVQTRSSERGTVVRLQVSRDRVAV